jgi:hypothetical protein
MSGRADPYRERDCVPPPQDIQSGLDVDGGSVGQTVLLIIAAAHTRTRSCHTVRVTVFEGSNPTSKSTVYVCEDAFHPTSYG